MQVGAATAVSLRCSYKLRKGLSLRGAAQVGTTGIHAEAGVWRKWSDMMSGYAGVKHGILGTTVKVKVTRAGHTFELPILVTREWQDWQTLLIAFTAPPLISYLTNRCTAHPRRQISQVNRASL